MIFENEVLFIEWENSEIPWLKIFTKKQAKELSELSADEQKALFSTALACEKALLEFYKPDKINWASFANYVPKVHLHIQARFKNDSFFPESMWGKRQREGKAKELKKSEFESFLKEKLSNFKG